MRVLAKFNLLSPPNIDFDLRLKFLRSLLYLLFKPSAFFTKGKKSYGQNLATALTKLGPIYIKFGQSLSTRPDIIGEDIANSLKYLQDKLPPFSYAEVQNILTRNYGKNFNEIFASFDEKPVAAASIAQVHKATLISGEIVAVKILRPNIRAKYTNDIDLISYLANFIDKYSKEAKRIKPNEIVSLFRDTMEFELDMRLEAAAGSKLKENFIKDDSILVPEIFWQYTTNDILISTWIDGVSIYNRKKLIALGHDPRALAAKIAVLFFNMAYRDGYFHADLHPGNILVNAKGQIVLLDFGIMGKLPEEDRFAIAEMIYAIVQRDYVRVANIHRKIGYIPSGANIDHFTQTLRAFVEPIIGLAIKDISVGNLLANMFKITKQYGLEVQPQLLLLQKTIVVVEGIGQSLDPDINMWKLAEPWIKKWAAKNLSPEAKILRKVKKFFDDVF